jgi:hypothetical protein
MRRFGAGVLCAGLAALAAIIVYRVLERPRITAADDQEEPEHVGAARYLNGAAAILSFSVLTDSAMEHYRGAYHNPAMYLPPAVAGASLANSLHMTLAPAHFGVARTALCGVALATGIGGFGFHLYNVGKREGGFDFLNLFYGPPSALLSRSRSPAWPGSPRHASFWRASKNNRDAFSGCPPGRFSPGARRRG